MSRVCAWVPPGLIGMCLCALVLNRVICLIFWFLIVILLYCSVCVSIYVVHYLIAFLIISLIALTSFHHHRHIPPHVNTCHHTLPYSLKKFVILIFVGEKIFIQVYSNPDEFPVSLISGHLTNIRQVRQEAMKFSVCHKMQSTMTLSPCDRSFFHMQ